MYVRPVSIWAAILIPSFVVCSRPDFFGYLFGLAESPLRRGLTRKQLLAKSASGRFGKKLFSRSLFQ